MSRSATTTRATMTVEKWGELPEDEGGELVNGELVEDEMPTIVHELLVVVLAAIFRRWLIPKGGYVGGSATKLAISENRGRKPDLYAYFPDRPLPDPEASVVEIPPDLVVEVVSGSPRDKRRDRIEKVREYATFGVRLYWLVDPEIRSLEVLELGSHGRYEHAVAATEGHVKELPGCPGLMVDLDEIWSEVDQYVEAATSQPED